MKLYPNALPWPAPQSKSIGDNVRFFQTDILNWIRAGLSLA